MIAQPIHQQSAFLNEFATFVPTPQPSTGITSSAANDPRLDLKRMK